MNIPKTRVVVHFPYDKVRLLPLILSVAFLIPNWLTAESKNDRPFNAGDHFYYDIKWGFLKVGEAEVIVEKTNEDDPGDLKFILLVKTTSWADTIYRIRNRIESYTDAEVSQSLHYVKSQREGGRKREIVVDFDWDVRKAHYANFGESKPPIDILEGTHDPFSVIFAFRLREFALGKRISVPVTDGRKSRITDIDVLEEERIKVKAGKFNCLRVRPDVKDLGGVFSKSKDSHMDIWFSDDNHKLIVKMSSSVRVGSFKVELREYILGVNP